MDLERLLELCRHYKKNKLIDVGAFVNCKNEEGNTPLHVACMTYRDLELIQGLIDKGADVNSVNAEGETPLHLACFDGFFGIVHILVENGAEMNCKDHQGNTPLHRACSIDIMTVEWMIKKGAKVDCISKNGTNSLHWACLYGHVHVARFLIEEKGFDVNCTDENGNTPLHLNYGSWRLSFVRLLVEKGAKLDLKNKAGYTALQLAPAWILVWFEIFFLCCRVMDPMIARKVFAFV